MSVLYSVVGKPTKLQGAPFDKDNENVYTITYRPIQRVSDNEYYLDDVIIPTISNGHLYECTSGGVSDSVEPVFSPVANELTTDGDAVFIAKPYNLLLRTGDFISSSDWACDDAGAVFDAGSIVGMRKTKTKLTAITAGLSSVTLINSISVIRANGDTEIFDHSIIIPVKEQ